MHLTDHFCLAQATKSTQMDAVVWVAALIVLAIVGGLFILWVRRRTLGDASDGGGSGSLMDDLRAMRDRGEITAEEFDATRKAMSRRLAAKLKEGESAPSKPRPRAHNQDHQSA